MHIQAVVADAISDNNCWLLRSRSRNPTISLLRSCLLRVDPILSSESEDVYKWKFGNNPPSNSFSASHTWESLNPFLGIKECGSKTGSRNMFLDAGWLLKIEYPFYSLRTSSRDEGCRSLLFAFCVIHTTSPVNICSLIAISVGKSDLSS